MSFSLGRRLILLVPLVFPSPAVFAAVPETPVEQAMAAAEASLRAGRVAEAEGQYRAGLAQGWMLLGTLQRVEGRLGEAESAFRAASAGGSAAAPEALALLLIQKGEPAEAVTILEGLAAKDPTKTEVRRLLAQALLASGRPDRAVSTLEEVHAADPANLEVAFALADGYLGLKDVGRAARLFARIVEARPLPQTHVLIGGAYREAGEYARAEAELQAALKQDPRVRRAHYGLGMALLDAKGLSGVDEAIPHFREELRLAPDDPAASLELGVALVESQRGAEAVAPLEVAARSTPPSARALYYLGRALLGAGRPADGVPALRRALVLSGEQGGNAHALRGIHVQLGQALRALGQTEKAGTHFAEAARLSGQEADEARDRFARPSPDPEEARSVGAPLPVIESTPLAQLTAAGRDEMARRLKVALARAYLNLGVIQAQGQHFTEAADLLEKAAALDPDFPQVQSSLGVAYFNAREFAKATVPLTRATAVAPADRGLRRMLALAWLNTDAYAKAANLLQDDPDLEKDPSLAFAYGLALVKSDRGVEAERVFSRLVRTHGDSAELNVFLGQAHAQQGDFAAAIESLSRALQQKPDVAEASATLGVIYLRQGRLPEAETALGAAVKEHPGDVTAQQNLATVLDLQQRGEEAVTLLRAVVRARPELANARYLLGKILLSQGAAAEAVEQLRAAAGVAPGEANIHYQLGKAYQKLGQVDLAEQEFARFRELKAAP